MPATLKNIDASTLVLGDKWTPKLLRHFLVNNRVRFCQLQDLTDEINPRTLSARLLKLERQGIIVKHKTSLSRCEYSLTKKGKDLLPVIDSMSRWSEKYP